MPTTRCQLYWRDLQKFFDTLPLEQFQQATLLLHNIAVRYSDDGQLQNILLRRQDYPLLDQHSWLFDDWSVQNVAFEKHLMLGLAFRFIELDLRANIADPLSHQDESFLPLADTLAEQAQIHLKQLFSDSSSFWNDYQQTALGGVPAAVPFGDAGAKDGGLSDIWALISLSVTAAAFAADKESLLPQLLELTDHLRGVYQTVMELASLRVDLRDGRVSYPIQRVMQAAGIKDIKNLSADFLFGALILTGALEKLCAENHARVAEARTLAERLNLPSFIQFCGETDSLLRQIRNQFGLKKQAGAEGACVEPSRNEPLRGFFVPAIDVIPNILQKAEGYLLSDLTFRETWEVQRSSYNAYPLLTGKTFAATLVLDILCRHGHAVSAAIDSIFDIYEQNQFCYYDSPEAIAPDIDTLAFPLRLYPYASDPERRREFLKQPLRWVRENQLPSGQIPVWLRFNDSKYQISPLVVLYGENCATVEANLLIGLIEFDWDGFQDVITACAVSWCERWLAMGLGATGHYTPLFSFWTSLELISKLLKKDISSTLRADLTRLAAQLVTRLQTEGARPSLTPQAASFLTLACLRNPEFSLPFNPAWITTLVKRQQWDGKWTGEPIFVTPSGRGLGTLWIASHTITSAFCYHALKTYQSTARFLP